MSQERPISSTICYYSAYLEWLPQYHPSHSQTLTSFNEQVTIVKIEAIKGNVDDNPYQNSGNGGGGALVARDHASLLLLAAKAQHSDSSGQSLGREVSVLHRLTRGNRLTIGGYAIFHRRHQSEGHGSHHRRRW
jgi:hypothetical protein